VASSSVRSSVILFKDRSSQERTTAVSNSLFHVQIFSLIYLLNSAQLGLAFLHVAVDGRSPEVRRAVIKALEAEAAKQPQLVNRIVKESLTELLTSDKPKTTVNLGQETPAYKQVRLSAFLSSTTAIADDVDLSTRENFLTELIVLGHHPIISMSSSRFCDISV